MKIFLLLLSSIVLPIKLFSIVVGTGCLKHEKSGQKIVLIHDKHDGQQFPQRPLHQKELTQLIEALSKKNNKCSFYIEYPPKADTFKKTYDTHTIHVPVNDALAHKMNHGSIVYKPFDENTENDFWAREMIINAAQVLQAYKNNHPFPASFKSLTIKAYLDTIQEHEKACQIMIQKLPIVLQEYATQKLSLYQRTRKTIEDHAVIQKLNQQDHITRLTSALAAEPLNKLIVEMNTVHSDIALLYSISQDSNPLIIVHGGAYHTQSLEKILTKIGFKPAFPERDLSPGLDALDLSKILLPSVFESSFNRSINEFLTLCTACGKESTAKCGGCKKSYYCSGNCQKADWTSHKLTCKK